MGMGFASLIAFMIKLNAIACQQKLIGERMAHKLYIRQVAHSNLAATSAIAARHWQQHGCGEIAQQHAGIHCCTHV